MKQHLLENGLKAVADYYLSCSKHVQASYGRACRVVRKFYGEFGFEEYNPAHDDEIMNQVLAGRTLTPESSYMFCRYTFHSHFAQDIQAYISLRESIGYKEYSYDRSLHMFDRFWSNIC